MGKGIVERAVLAFRTEGPSGVWQRVWNRLSKKPVYRRLLVLRGPLRDDLPVIKPKVPVTFEELRSSDFGELIALRPYLTEEVIRLRFEAGHRFYVAKLNGKIVHTHLVAVNRAYIGYLEIAFPLSPREVYFGEAYTRPEYRRNSIYLACHSFVSKKMCQLGYQNAVGFVHHDNRPALGVPYKMGDQIRGHIGFIEVFGIRRYFYGANDGGFDCLHNALFVPREKLVPAELQGQIW